MIDLEKERKAFEAVFGFDSNKFEFAHNIAKYTAKINDDVMLVASVNLAWSGWLACCSEKQSEIDALKAQVAEHKSQQVLTLTKIYNCLHKANSEGLINDTIWLSNHETLFDFISSEILNCGGKVEVQQ